MEQLIELLRQINELSAVGIEALEQASGGGAAPGPEGGAPGGPAPEGPPPGEPPVG